MANTFYPKPVIGGSINVWGTYLDMLVRAGGIGALTCELYNDSGALKLSKGKIGINDGTYEGVAVIDTITTIDTTGMTANNWHKIELSVSGASVTIAIAAIAAATDESVIDAATKAAYDYEKAGYYLTDTKRLLGVVYLRTALAPGRIVNCKSGKLGFKGIKIIDYYTSAYVISQVYLAKVIFEIGNWNMNISGGGSATKTIQLNNYLGSSAAHLGKKIRNAYVIIRDDTDANYLPVNESENGADPGLLAGGITYFLTGATSMVLSCRTGGEFDNASYNESPFNRGWVNLEYET